MTAANEAWSIEISPKDAPDTVRHEHELIELDVNGTEWQSRFVDTAVDVPGRSAPSYFTVLVGREPRSVAKVSETLATISGSSADVPAGQDSNVISGQTPYGRARMAGPERPAIVTPQQRWKPLRLQGLMPVSMLRVSASYQL